MMALAGVTGAFNKQHIVIERGFKLCIMFCFCPAGWCALQDKFFIKIYFYHFVFKKVVAKFAISIGA